MPEIAEVIRQIREDNSIYDAANAPSVGFINRNNQPLLGSTILPDRLQDNNYYSSENVAFLDVIADDADRYSPPRFKGRAARVSALEVALGEVNIGQQLWAAEYDRLIQLVPDNSDQALVAMARIMLDFAGAMSRGMASRSEVQRWAAMVSGEVERIVGEARSLVQYPSDTDQRAALVNVWSDDTYDPMEDFEAAAEWGEDRGYNGIARIVTSGFGLRTFSRNQNTRINVYGEGEGRRRVQTSDVQSYVQDEGYPAIETYDTKWHDVGNRSGRYLPEDAIVFVFDTGNTDEELRRYSEANPGLNLADTVARGGVIGHNGIGTPGGEATPGRVVDLYEPQGRPKRVLGEGVATCLPVLDYPDGLFVRTGIR